MRASEPTKSCRAACGWPHQLPATFDGVANSSIYQGILGWASWLMPMSWGATALGLVVFVVNLVLAGITFQFVNPF